MTPEEINARLLYRDGLMLVLDKPAGLPVHRGPKGGDNLEASFDALRFGLPRAPALAHRLDKDTSGCLVLGRHRKALEKLGLLFKQGRISKTYWAVVEGTPEADEGLIDLPLGRLDATRGWWMKVDPLGQPSQSRWRGMGRRERAERMGYEHHGFCRLLDGGDDARLPVGQSGSMPIVLRDAPRRRQLRLPTALPMVRPGIAEAGDEKDVEIRGFHGPDLSGATAMSTEARGARWLESPGPSLTLSREAGKGPGRDRLTPRRTRA